MNGYHDRVNGGTISDPARFQAAIARFDQDNAADPNVERADVTDHPREHFFAQKLSDWLVKP